MSESRLLARKSNTDEMRVYQDLSRPSRRGRSDFDDGLCHVLTTTRRFRFDGVQQGRPLIVRGDVADLQIVTVWRHRVVTLVGGNMNVIAGGGVRLRFEAAFLERCLHPIRVPGRD